MNDITADGGKSFDNGRHFNTRLHQLVADDEPDVAGADHEDAMPRFHAVHIHHGLDGARPVDARQVIVGKKKILFIGAGGRDDFFRTYFFINAAVIDG